MKMSVPLLIEIPPSAFEEPTAFTQHQTQHIYNPYQYHGRPGPNSAAFGESLGVGGKEVLGVGRFHKVPDRAGTCSFTRPLVLSLVL